MSAPTGRSRVLADVAAVTGVILQSGLAVAMVEMHHDDLVARHAEGWLPALAFGSLVAVPAVLAVIGLLTSRSVLLLAAAGSGLLLLYVSPLFVVAVVPASLFAAAALPGVDSSSPSGGAAALAVTAPAVGFVVALVALVSARGWYEGPGYGGEYYLPSRGAIAIVAALVATVTAVTAALRTTRA